MDKKLERYQTLITDLLKEYADSFNQSPKPIEAKLVFDYERHAFQLLNVGWRNGQYYFYVVFHFEIKNEKIWLLENRTDLMVAQALVEQGVPKTDIVLALQSPEIRAISGYATT